jgi:hypothetical protein
MEVALSIPVIWTCAFPNLSRRSIASYAIISKAEIQQAAGLDLALALLPEHFLRRHCSALGALSQINTIATIEEKLEIP